MSLRMRRYLTGLAGLGLLLALGGTSQAQLIVNGGFEDTGNAVFNGGTQYYFAPRRPALPDGRDRQRRRRCRRHPAYLPCPPPYEGSNNLDLNGNVPATIQQTFNSADGGCDLLPDVRLLQQRQWVGRDRRRYD